MSDDAMRRSGPAPRADGTPRGAGPAQGEPAVAGRIRTSDAEREKVAARLRDAMGEGRLTLDEGEQRLIAAYAATYRDELTGLTTDLPGADPGPAARGVAARAHVARRGGAPACGPLGRHATGVLAVAAILIGIWALSGAAFFWPAIPLGFLLVGLAKHAGMRRYGYGPPGGWPQHRHRVHSG